MSAAIMGTSSYVTVREWLADGLLWLVSCRSKQAQGVSLVDSCRRHGMADPLAYCVSAGMAAVAGVQGGFLRFGDCCSSSACRVSRAAGSSACWGLMQNRSDSRAGQP